MGIQYTFRASRGFTLIELLVVIGIITLIFSGSFAAFREFNRRQQLSEAVNLVKSDLLLAQQKALSGEKPASCTVLNGYSVTVLVSSYEVRAQCANGYLGIKSVNFSQGVTIQPTEIIFKVLGQGTTLLKDTTITLTQTSTGKTATITVSKGGTVY